MSAQLSNFEKEAIRVALSRMFQPDRYLDICTIQECLKVAGAIPPQRTMEALRAMHCVHWREMTPAMRQETAQVVLSLFDAPGFDLPTLHASFMPAAETAPALPSDTQPAHPAHRGFFARLLWKGEVS